MALDKSNVLVGTPDQLTTGAIAKAPIGTALPTDAVTALGSAFVAGGYVSEDGLKLTPSISTSDIRDWSGSLVRRIIQTFDGTLSWNMLQTDAESLKVAFGEANVTATAATSSHGNQLSVSLNATLPERASWAFSMKDGDHRIRVVVPDGQVTTVGEVSFTAGGAIVWPVTLSCYPDSSGNCIYIYTDDGAHS